MGECWFCHKPIEGKAERHHRTPRRYMRGKDHKRDNLVLVHHHCHVRWHRDFDDQRISLSGYLSKFADIELGNGVFKES